MADLATGGNLEVIIADASDNYAGITNNRLDVNAVTTVVAPPATTAVKITEKSSISGTVDSLYTITSGKTLTIQKLSGGAEASNSGHIIEAYDDPNGDLSVLNIIEDIYVNGDSNSKDLLGDFVGNGTRRFLLRRRSFGGGTKEVTGIWVGYET